MAFISFGYAAEALRNAFQTIQNRDMSPNVSGIGMMEHNMGDIAKSQIAQLRIAGASQDYIWGCHLWGSTKYKVTS